MIGEGEIDEAPMLYIGEKVGTGTGDAVDIAVDPIEGTRMTAMGQANALAVLAVGDKGSFLNAPDMYMEKLIVGPGAKGVIDLSLPLEQNLKNIAAALDKPLNELTVTILAKPRHDAVIAQMQQLGVRVFAIPDGDVAASILTCMPDSEVDVLYGIGGARGRRGVGGGDPRAGWRYAGPPAGASRCERRHAGKPPHRRAGARALSGDGHRGGQRAETG
ncbi:Fructose-1,6-bisphosphatase, GlpX type [Cronobacter universalis NCTC 9529]|nr:Fructose-1,6-bisphosphatase, GlpX type [Cronobacter universalis NCTC 9529]